MLYKYTARDKEGTLIEDSKEAESKKALATDLKQNGLLLTSASEMETSKGKRSMSLLSRLQQISTVPLEEKMFFTQNLHVMLHSGISLSVALDTLAEQTKNPRFKMILADVKQSVEKGTSLYDSLTVHKKVFGELFVNMVQAGEQSGQLESTLIQLRMQMKKDHDLRSKVKGAMIYPTVVIIAMIGVMITVVTFVIPKLTDLFTESNLELPLPTRILIAASEFMTTYGIIVGIFAVAFFVFFIRFIKKPPGKKYWDGFLLKAPIAAPIIKKINLARFSRTLSSLLKTDIPIVESFEITHKTLGNYHYQQVVKTAAEKLKKGISVTEALKRESDLYPPLIVQMISVGEESGSLDTILENLAVFYEETVTETMANFSSIIEPVLILLLGLGVGGIAVSVIMPIYSLTQGI